MRSLIVELPHAVINKFRADRLLRHAAALSFNSLLALAPMMAIVFAMLSLFTGIEQLGAQLEEFMFQFFVPTASAEVRSYIDQFAGQAGQLTLIGLSFFLLTALLLLNAIEASFNDIWHIKRGRNFVQKITVYWALISLGPLLMGASLAISTYLLSSNLLGSTELGGHLQSLGFRVLPFIFQWMAFALLYFVMPNVRVSLAHGLAGALVAAFLFEATKWLFALYITNFNSYAVVYGALSTLPIFLIWIYLSWVVALIGAEVVSVLQLNTESEVMS